MKGVVVAMPHPKHCYAAVPDVFATISRVMKYVLDGAVWDVPNKRVQLTGLDDSKGEDLSPPIASLDELRNTLSFLAMGIYLSDPVTALLGENKYTLQHAVDDVDDVLGFFDVRLEALGWIATGLPETLPTSSIVPMLELLKYINGGDAHIDEAREGAHEVLTAFDKLHPEVLTALHTPEVDVDDE